MESITAFIIIFIFVQVPYLIIKRLLETYRKRARNKKPNYHYAGLRNSKTNTVMAVNEYRNDTLIVKEKNRLRTISGDEFYDWLMEEGYIVFIAFCLIINFNLFAQDKSVISRPKTTTSNAKKSTLLEQLTNSPNNKKDTAKNTKHEIDRLYEKYKNSTIIVLYTSHGELEGNVEIEYNPDHKPQSIKIYGRSENKEAIAEFLSQVISQKYKQGYRSSDGNFENTDAEWIKIEILAWEGGVRTFKKGNMYFIVKGGCCKLETKTYDLGGTKPLTQTTMANDYWFSIETGDNNRKGGKKATKFEF